MPIAKLTSLGALVEVSLASARVAVVLLGACAGVAYVTGYTIVGSEVDDQTRGRTFAFLQSAMRVILFAVIAVAPFVAAGLTALVRGVSGTGTGEFRQPVGQGHAEYLQERRATAPAAQRAVAALPGGVR